MKFAQRNARLPIYLPKTKEVILIPWGRRPKEQSTLPFGCCARRAAIHAGDWDKFNPKPIRISVDGFMEEDVAGTAHWFEVTKGNFVQGLLATNQTERRVYVVCISPPADEVHFEQWPRLITGI